MLPSTRRISTEQTATVQPDLALYASLELSRSTWLITCLLPDRNRMSKYSTPGGDGGALLGLLERMRARAQQLTGRPVKIVAIQEAGLDGFWVHRLLEVNGIESHVVDPASIAVPRRRRRAKTDAMRHPDRSRLLFSGDVSGIESVHADVNDDAPVATALGDAWAVVNAVSLYVEHGKCTFQSVHVDAAGRVAMLARQTGVENFVHISVIGSDAGSASPYIRSRGKGEAAVLDGFPTAALIRPAVMFGAGDAFLTPLLTMLRDMPVFPMFGRGETRLQPAYVEDVAEAIARVLRAPAARHPYELAGPHVYTYQALLRTIAAIAGKRPFLFPFPFRLWHVIGYLGQILPSPPLTRNQVELMEKDNLPNPDAPGFEALRISPQAIEDILPQLMQRAKEAADP